MKRDRDGKIDPIVTPFILLSAVRVYASTYNLLLVNFVKVSAIKKRFASIAVVVSVPCIDYQRCQTRSVKKKVKRWKNVDEWNLMLPGMMKATDAKWEPASRSEYR